MRGLCASIVVVLAGAALAQEAPANAPHVVKYLKAPGLEVRYLDFGWDPEAFASLEQGGDHPVGRRSWVLARLLLPRDPLKWEGRTIGVGTAILILHPGKRGVKPGFELRTIDMREVFTDLNVIAEPPAGDTLAAGPANFEKADSTAERLEVALSDRTQTLELTIHYGDRRAKLVLAR